MWVPRDQRGQSLSIPGGRSPALDGEVALGLRLLQGVLQQSCATDPAESLCQRWCQWDVTPGSAATVTLWPCAGGSVGLGEVRHHES